jgi:outer membrane protein OmpA-like peptidoglycan-associated protein
MRLKTLMLAATMIAGLDAAAPAQPFQGVYVGAGAGFNYAEPARIIGATGPGAAQPNGNHYDFDAGFVGVGSVGYGFGNGVRIELEGNYRDAHVRKLSTTVTPTSTGGANQTYGGMANVLFDIDVGSPWVYPYLGAGAGVEATNLDTLTTITRNGGTVRIRDTQANFGFQAIAGLSFPVYGVPGLSVTTEYRFLGVEGHESFDTARSNVSLVNAAGTVVTAPASGTGRTKIGAQYNHAALIGVRYAFNVAPPPQAAAAAVAPAAAPARSYLVFFDWDRADLTDRARQIVAEAAQNSTHVQYTRIEVNGYTDTSGTAAYNQRLSVRRAQNVAAELVKDGVPRQAISIQGFGETHLLVPTAQGVREPQNRRVEIIIR